jgi:Raf kinase inhibitor-like YbhB/YbcL family protein
MRRLVVLGLLLAGVTAAEGSARFTLTSPAFRNGAAIPTRFSCEGRNVSPTLRWTAPPRGARSLALVMDDPDAPGGTFNHWLAWNIRPSARSLAEGTRPPREGTNSAGRTGYVGPCPPSGRHRYIFRLYALSRPLPLARGARSADFRRALRGRVLATARLAGTYER